MMLFAKEGRTSVEDDYDKEVISDKRTKSSIYFVGADSGNGIDVIVLFATCLIVNTFSA